VTNDVELPGPAWKLKEITGGNPTVFLVFEYATFRTNETLWLWKSKTGGAAPYVATLTGTAGKDVTHRLTQRRWSEIYCKAIAGQALLGRKPEIVEEIF
jgi:hypothetical protein